MNFIEYCVLSDLDGVGLFRDIGKIIISYLQCQPPFSYFLTMMCINTGLTQPLRHVYKWGILDTVTYWPDIQRQAS